MAYPTVSSTYGFKPLQRLDGLPYAGAIRQIPVAAGYATAILNGDTVKTSGGYLVAASTTNSGDIVGVVVGCQYVNSLGQTVEGQYYPAAASTTTALAYAYVVDDPNAVFQVCAATAGSTTPAAYARSIVGKNVALIANVGSTNTGDSAYGIDGSSATTTSTFPLRVVDVITASATGTRYGSATTYYEFVVKLNTAQYNDQTGA
jgi:FlaG/FlaF family flagellin (archaellin)